MESSGDNDMDLLENVSSISVPELTSTTAGPEVLNREQLVKNVINGNDRNGSNFIENLYSLISKFRLFYEKNDFQCCPYFVIAQNMNCLRVCVRKQNVCNTARTKKRCM